MEGQPSRDNYFEGVQELFERTEEASNDSSSGISRRDEVYSMIELQNIVRIVLEDLGRQRIANTMGTGQPQQVIRTSSVESFAADQDFVNIWHQIKMATILIPSFSGKDGENVVKWLDRIINVARIYHLEDKVIIMAAISQLKGRALNWYHLQPVESMLSWQDFKYNIRQYFEIKEAFPITLARINRRIWKMHAEKFIDYAEEKLNLMQTLSLTENEKIDLLANGIKDPGLRNIIYSSDTILNDNIPAFLEYARRVTENVELSI